MRAAAILGLGTSPEDLQRLQTGGTDFSLGVPADPSGFDAILVFGGDGTVHRHLSQLVRLHLPVLVVPCGSGNDFARALGLHKLRNSLGAWRSFCAGSGNTREIDLGTITEIEKESPAGQGLATRHLVFGARHYFACVAGAGLDGEIARRANAMPRWLRRHGGYALGIPLALASFRKPGLRLEVADAHGAYRTHHNGPALLAVFANTPVYGDGMRVAPHARMDDGLLDTCLVGPLSKAKIAALFPSVYFGQHLGLKGVSYFQAANVRVATDPLLDVYADGEFVCRTPVEVGIAAGALRVIVPGR